MTISELARIAARYFTAMADAMIRACVSKAVETGERLELPERKPAKVRGKSFDLAQFDEMSDEEWRRMCEGNSDTRHQHV